MRPGPSISRVRSIRAVRLVRIGDRRRGPGDDEAVETWTWSQHIVWGTHNVWGTSIDTNKTACSLDTVRGSNAAWSGHIVWGTDIVWQSADQVAE